MRVSDVCYSGTDALFITHYCNVVFGPGSIIIITRKVTDCIFNSEKFPW